MNKILNAILEYSKTIFITIVCVFIVVIFAFVIIQHQVYESQEQDQLQDDSIQYSLVGVLIQKNKYLEEEYPKNYKINLKLGVLYEIYKDYNNSEAEYKLAIEKAPYTEFKPQYKLANLYIRMDRLDDAQKVMDDILERPDKKLIDYKGTIYSRIGDQYYNNGDYASAIPKYEKAMSYFNIIKSKKAKDVKNSLASAYVYIAERYVSNMQIDAAITCLTTANSLVNAPILKYKLALLLINSNPGLAYNYFEEVFKKEPSIINYDVYYNFLSKLAKDAEVSGDSTQAKLFRYKAEKFKEYYNNNILTINDIALEYSNGEMIFNPWTRKYKINFEFKIKNTSKRDLNSLFINIVFKADDVVFSEYSAQIIDNKDPLKAGDLSPLIYLNAYKARTPEDNKTTKFTADISVSKLQNSYKIYLKTVDLELMKKSKKHNWKINLDNYFHKIYHKNIHRISLVKHAE